SRARRALRPLRHGQPTPPRPRRPGLRPRPRPPPPPLRHAHESLDRGRDRLSLLRHPQRRPPLPGDRPSAREEEPHPHHEPGLQRLADDLPQRRLGDRPHRSYRPPRRHHLARGGELPATGRRADPHQAAGGKGLSEYRSRFPRFIRSANMGLPPGWCWVGSATPSSRKSPRPSARRSWLPTAERVRAAAEATTGAVLPARRPRAEERCKLHPFPARLRAAMSGVSLRTQRTLDWLARRRPDLHVKVKAGIL